MPSIGVIVGVAEEQKALVLRRSRET